MNTHEKFHLEEYDIKTLSTVPTVWCFVSISDGRAIDCTAEFSICTDDGYEGVEFLRFEHVSGVNDNGEWSMHNLTDAEMSRIGVYLADALQTQLIDYAMRRESADAYARLEEMAEVLR